MYVADALMIAVFSLDVLMTMHTADVDSSGAILDVNGASFFR